MSSRYSKTRIKRDKSGIKLYSTTYYPDISIEDEDTFIYPSFGERLDTLAHKYYNDVSLWWIIAKANGIKGKLTPSVDTQIRIPSNIPKILEDFDNLNK
jgi:hypothetical protein